MLGFWLHYSTGIDSAFPAGWTQSAKTIGLCNRALNKLQLASK